MQFVDNGSYMMPIAFGARPSWDVAHYGDNWNVAALYLTDKDALVALLPPGFEPADEPLVTMFYTKCNKVDFLNGGGYNLMGVNLAAVFNGKDDHVRGNFAAVLWENLTTPILAGRELLGAPKLYGDILDPFRVGDDWRVHASENGRILIEMCVRNAQPVSEDMLRMMQEQVNAVPWLGWRYFPTVDGRGTSISEPVKIGSDSTVDAAWFGEPEIAYGDVDADTHAVNAHILAGLRTLVVREYRGGFITHGTNKLLISENRVLR